jgi:hypothetical protein
MSALENFSSTFTPFRRKTMTNRRNFLALSALTASLFPIQKVLAQAGESSTTTATGEADFLFVQTAKSMSYDPATQQLTLIDASPTTLFFSDRPERIAGNMTTETWVHPDFALPHPKSLSRRERDFERAPLLPERATKYTHLALTPSIPLSQNGRGGG